MAGSRSAGLKFLLCAVGVVAAVGFQMWRNGAPPKFLERFFPAKQGKVLVDAPPEVKLLVDESVKRAQVARKVPVIRFNLVNCGVCERVSRDVFTKPEWTKFAADKLEISEYLMPTTVSSDQPELVNKFNLFVALSKSSGAEGGFPLIAVMGKDGSILGARSGYHAGGAPGYIKWVEGLIASDTSVPRGNIEEETKANPPEEKVKAPAPIEAKAPVSTASQPAPVTNETAETSLEIVVKGVSGTGANKVVLLGIGKRNYPVFAGDNKKVQFNGKPLQVACREIGEKEIVIKVEGEEAERRLSLNLE